MFLHIETTKYLLNVLKDMLLEGNRVLYNTPRNKQRVLLVVVCLSYSESKCNIIVLGCG